MQAAAGEAVPEREDRPARERILAAALSLVQSHGLQTLSQARVATAAGMRQSHLTYYFPTRKDLLKGLVESIKQEMMQAISDPGGGRRLSIAGVREFFCLRIREPLLPRLMLALMVAADEDPSLREWLTAFDREVLEHLRAIFLELGLRPTEKELGLFHVSVIGASILGAQMGTAAAAERAARLTRLAFDRLMNSSRPRRGRHQA